MHIGLDDLPWPRLGVAFLFWMRVVAVGASGWRVGWKYEKAVPVHLLRSSAAVHWTAEIGQKQTPNIIQVWPTGFNDYKLTVTPEVLQRLRNLQSERKFGPDSVTFYPGAVNEGERLRAQEAVDSTIQAVITELPEHPQRSTVLRAIKVTLTRFDTPESEERDQVLVYLTKVMEICGVHSSAELFNVWRYGFP